MVYIITRREKSFHHRKDGLHRRRKELVGQIKDGLLSKSEMNKGNEGEPEFDKRVSDYDKWKKKKEPLMREWSDVNKTFKKHGEEGKPLSIDFIREELSTGKKVKYE